MNFLEKTIGGITNTIFFDPDCPPKNRYLYRFAKKYVDFWNNENGDMRTNGELVLLRRLITEKKIKTLFDVGTNHGDYTAAALAGDSTIKVYGFEPDPELYVELKEKFAQHPNVHINNVGADSVSGEHSFYVHGEERGLNSFYDIQDAAQKKKITIATTTLDEYVEKNGISHIDFMKIDIEGNEFRALQGAWRLINSGAVDIIQFEYGHAAIFARVFLKDILDILPGYDIYRIKQQSQEKVVYGPELEKCACINFLAVRKGISL